jgi:predicted acylesterase/phospholipase RssA
MYIAIMFKPKHLVFAGGGAKCLSFLGAIEVLHKADTFKQVSHYWGTSAGAIVATFMCLKIPMPKLRSMFETLEFTRFRDIDLANIVTFGDKWGLDSGDAFIRHMKELLESAQPGASHYTMQELPGLHITTADITDTKIVVLDGTTFPTLKLVDALRASTSIPFFYRPFRNPINNHLLVDGGVGYNFPWVLLPTDEDRKSALGFNFKKVISSNEPESLSEYIPRILTFREMARKIDSGENNTSPNIIDFNITGFPSWHLNLKQSDKDELFKVGKSAAEKWINSHSDGEMRQRPHTSSHQDIQSKNCPSSTQLLGTHEFQHQPLPQDQTQGSPSLPPRSYRRWSV